MPILSRAGLDAQFHSPRAGFFPKGGGQIELAVSGGSIPCTLDLTERGNLLELIATIVTSNLPDHVAERGAQTIEKFMKGVGRKVTINIQRPPSLDLGGRLPDSPVRERRRRIHGTWGTGKANGEGGNSAMRGVYGMVENRCCL